MVVRWLGLLGLVAGAAASGRVAPVPTPDPAQFVRFPCLPVGTAKGTRIVALGAYSGGGRSPFGLAHGGSETKAIAVSAARRGVPLVLVLSAYDPVVWDLAAVPRSRLRAVLVFGYHGQGVAGVARSTVLRFSTYSGGDGACGKPTYAYEGGTNLEALDASIRTALGRGIDDFQGSYSAAAYDVDHGPLGEAALDGVAVQDLRASEPFEAGQLAGEAGIARLVAEGAIRPATQQDIADLDAARTRSSPTGHLAPVHSRLGIRNVFVVLRPITVPKGMYGAHSATFLIPAGVPRPIDEGSHNGYISLIDGSTSGLAQD